MKLIIDLENIKFGSLNKKYKGNFKLTDEYKTFKGLLLNNILRKKLTKIDPPYSILISVSMYQDIDNIIKPIFDALEAAEIIDNDRNVRHLVITKYPIKKRQLGSLAVFITNLEK